MDLPLPSARHAAWLDPLEPPSRSCRDAFSGAGWAVRHEAALTPSSDGGVPADAYIVRLIDERSLSGLDALAGRGALVCRVPAHRLDLAAGAGRAGAVHVLADDEHRASVWEALLRRLRDPAESGRELRRRSRPRRAAVFVDPVSQKLLALARRVAQAEVTTLLVGDTGSGKEVLARVLHEASPRSGAPFVAFNCAALPEHLIEDLLFGHERGAFTGAHRDHRGLFEQAQGGTLFLDEIGDMPIHLQAKLLRALQERAITRLGGSTVTPVDVRVIAATAKNLKSAIAERLFREDLFYRIATFQLRIAPLCDRPGDILPLAQAFLERLPARNGAPWRLSEAAAGALLRYPWPGNVRELENVMQRAVVLAAEPWIAEHELLFDDPPDDRPARPVAQSVFLVPEAQASNPAPKDWSNAPAVPQGDLSSSVRLNELQIIEATLAASSSRAEAAQRLGISPRTLRYKLAQMREHGLQIPSV